MNLKVGPCSTSGDNEYPNILYLNPQKMNSGGYQFIPHVTNFTITHKN